jgi:hypothetical protein
MLEKSVDSMEKSISLKLNDSIAKYVSAFIVLVAKLNDLI